VNPGHDLDQRRLAGAVVTEQADDLAGEEPQRDVAENLDAAERLRDVPELEPRRRFGDGAAGEP
jgi:hypothetical protein